MCTGPRAALRERARPPWATKGPCVSLGEHRSAQYEGTPVSRAPRDVLIRLRSRWHGFGDPLPTLRRTSRPQAAWREAAVRARRVSPATSFFRPVSTHCLPIPPTLLSRRVVCIGVVQPARPVASRACGLTHLLRRVDNLYGSSPAGPVQSARSRARGGFARTYSAAGSRPKPRIGLPVIVIGTAPEVDWALGPGVHEHTERAAAQPSATDSSASALPAGRPARHTSAASAGVPPRWTTRQWPSGSTPSCARRPSPSR